MVEDSGRVYAGTVDPATAVGLPLGPNSYFNASFPPATGGFYNQFNTISTLSDELGVFFSTAFHCACAGRACSAPLPTTLNHPFHPRPPTRNTQTTFRRRQRTPFFTSSQILLMMVHLSMMR